MKKQVKKKKAKAIEKPYINMRRNGKTVIYKATKKVYRAGAGGGIALPKDLVGECVYVEYEDINEGKVKNVSIK